MRWAEISKMPTIFKNENGGLCHESLLRGYQILDEVKRLLASNVPADTLLKIIEVMEIKTTETTPEPPAETSAEPLVDDSYTGQIATLRAANKKMREALEKIINVRKVVQPSQYIMWKLCAEIAEEGLK